MTAGFVTTARGQKLNIEELIAKGNRALEPDAKSTSEISHYHPAPQQPKIRGFVPAAGSVTLKQDNSPQVEETTEIPSKKSKKPTTTKTVADETRVVLTKPTNKKTATKKASEVKEDSELGALLGKLDTTK